MRNRSGQNDGAAQKGCRRRHLSQKKKDPKRCKSCIQDAKQTGLRCRNPACGSEDQQIADRKLHSPEDREQGDILRSNHRKV